MAPRVEQLNLNAELAGIEYDEDRRRASLPVDALIELLDELSFERQRSLTMFSEWVDVERAVYAVHRPVSLPGGVFCQADGQPSPCGTIREMFAARGIAYRRPGPFGAKEGGITFSAQEAAQAEANYHRTGRYTTDPPADGRTGDHVNAEAAQTAGRPQVYRYAASGRVYHWPVEDGRNNGLCGRYGLDMKSGTDPSTVAATDKCRKRGCRAAWESHDADTVSAAWHEATKPVIAAQPPRRPAASTPQPGTIAQARIASEQ